MNELLLGLTVVSAMVNRLYSHLLSAFQGLYSPATKDISGHHVAECLLVAAVVVVVDEVGNGAFQLAK